jgi:thymidylate synthase
VRTIDGFSATDLRLEGYRHHASIKAPIAV